MATFQETITETPGVGDAPSDVANYLDTIAEAVEASESLTGAILLNEPKRNPTLGDTATVTDGDYTLSFEWSNLDHAFELDGSTSAHVAINKTYVEEVTWGDEDDALKPSDEDCGEWVPDEVNSDLFGVEIVYAIDSAGMTAAGYDGLDPDEVLSALEIEDVYLEVFYEEEFTFGTFDEFGDSFISVERDGPVALAVGVQGQVYRETDPATNAWEDISPNTHEFAEDILSVEYDNRSGKYFLSGKNGFVATSSDAGDTWTRKTPFDTGQHITKLLPASSRLALTGSNRLGLVGADLDNLKNAHTFISPYGIIVPCYTNLLANEFEFDGNTYLHRNAGLTGISDSKEFTLSFWAKAATADWIAQMLQGRGGGLGLFYSVGSNFSDTLTIESPAGSPTILELNANNLWPGDVGTFEHWFISVDLTNSANRALYKNGTDLTNDASTDWDTYADTAIAFSSITQWFLGADSFNLNTSRNIVLAELWFDTQYLDPATNLSSFYNAGGPTAISLGENGETPTGSSPLVCLNKASSEWHKNAGTGGDFEVVTV